MQMIEIPVPDFDLAKTLDSGQVFHWEKIGDGFGGAIGGLARYVGQRGEGVKISAGPRCGTVARYFALDHPLAQICASFPQDETMNAAGEFCRGLRIIRQPKWECLPTFLCSSSKKV